MPDFRSLAFNMQQQECNNWCWAATSASISLFYDKNSNWTQCKIACSALRRNDCCPAVRNGPCDKSFYLDEALEITNNFVQPIIESSLPFDEIRKQIDTSRIVGVRIRWSNGDGHFVALHGYQVESFTDFVLVADPIYGKKIYRYSSFLKDYRQVGGEWSHSYKTKPAMPPIMLTFPTINEQLLKRVLNIKPQTFRVHEKKIRFGERDESVIRMPHRIYLIDYASLKNGKVISVKEIGYRIVNEKDDSFLLCDFDNDSAEALLQQVTYDEQYNKKYRDILQSIVTNQKNTVDEYSLSIVIQPQLKAEAFWLHNEADPKEDQYFSLNDIGGFELGRKYNTQEFLAILVINVSVIQEDNDPRMGS